MNVPMTTALKGTEKLKLKQSFNPQRSVQEKIRLNAAWGAIQPIDLDLAHLEKHRIVGHLAGSESLAFDMLRTRLLQQMRDQGWRRVAITSPTAQCGKSTVALNLALSLQREPETRTILLEMDLRRPSLCTMLGASQGSDLAPFLTGESPFEDSSVRVGENLAIAASRTPVAGSAKIIGSSYLPLALSALEDAYAPDLMIFDTPPMLLTHDVMTLAKHVDCVLLVAGADVTTSKQIDQCERDIAGQAQMLGVILNKCRHQGPGYGYGTYD
jgi:Mrp family chromosome partitioning ATPase